MDVYSNYAHRSMVRLFDFNQMKFVKDNLIFRELHPPVDPENSYVMLNYQSTIVTAGYQGDFIPTIRGDDGKTLLYALRPSKYLQILS